MISYPDSDAALDRALRSGAAEPMEFQQTVRLERPWRTEPDSLELTASYRIFSEAGRRRVRMTLGDHELFLDDPVRLAPVHVGKPWGHELWLTGIEARGESRVVSATGELPLSQYLALAPRHLVNGASLVLLKILDPKPEPVSGDLYFETHDEKREVYVVSHVDPRAWPDGRGRIRFGMNQALRERYADDGRFRADYLAAVRAYERVRRAIDEGAGDDPTLESQRRAAMEAFTELRELGVGDVVVVPTWLPHSLQHGVRVIEFQTPSYERYIISFAQRVVTQNHWDSETAVANMRLDAPPPPRFERVAEGVERIVSFDDFQVWRVTLPPGAELTLPAHCDYAVCIGVRGSVRVGPLSLGPEQAALVPTLALRQPQRGGARLHNATDVSAIALVAAPAL
ncbi:MAG: hypothetical protein RIC56_00535 [Pseudomonadales bacterium]